MKNRLFISLLVGSLIGTFSIQAQESDKSLKPIIPVVKLGDNVQVKFGGFVRADYYVDSREAVGAVDDLFGFFPEIEKNNSGDAKDQNEVVRQNLSTQATRFNGLFTGPDAFHAKSSAFFEYDFSGGPGTQTTTGATSPVGLRLRHAWAKLAWNKTEVLVGKTWNPLAETIFPSVVGLHTGIPFRPFGRADQVRVTLKPISEISVLLAAVYQSEHKSYVYPDASQAATASNINDIRSNPIPDFHVQLHYKNKDLFAGVVAEYKVVRPATQTTGISGVFNTDETVSSYAFGGFADYKKGLFELKGSVLYGQNLSELFQQGGYAVKTYDAATGARTYSVSNSTSGWINATYGTKLVVGIFGGYQKNLGFNDNILSTTSGGVSTFLGRWQNVDHIYRIAPSLTYNIGRWKFQGELDYNVAAYGIPDYTDKGKVKDAKEISGIRGLLATTFLF
jgi:hypothetical protein